MSAAIATFGAVPKPNQSVKSGAIATIGVSFTRMASGNSVRSRGRDEAITVASTNATLVPSTKPAAASLSVTPPSRARSPASAAIRAPTAEGAGNR